MTSNIPQTTSELIERTRSSWAAFEAVLAPLDTAALEQPGPDGGWSVKDHLTHLTAWLKKQTALIDGLPAHEGLGIDEALYRQGDIDAINAAVYERYHTQPADSALAELRQAHTIMLERLTTMDDSMLQRANNLTEPSDRRRLVEGIIANTYDHYDEHREWILAMLRER